MSKMSAWEKSERKAMMSQLPSGSRMLFCKATGFTLLIVPEGPDVAKLTTARASASDKPKRKMGQYLVLERYFNGEGMPVDRDCDAHGIMTSIGASIYIDEYVEFVK